MAETKYLSCAETAKLIRAELKEKFPKQKFSVRSSVYSGGASIDISWTDGVAESEVDKVVKKFNGAGFDGMIDYKYYNKHWLHNGKIYYAGTDGSACCMGVHLSENVGKPHPDAIEVSLGADFIFTRREISEEMRLKIAKDFADAYGLTFDGNLNKQIDTLPICLNFHDVIHRLIFGFDLTQYHGIRATEETCGTWESFVEVY